MVIGLTGGIGMGKSTVSAMFARLGVPGFSADAAVHELQAPGGKAIAMLATAFPGTVAGGVLNRAALRQQIFSDTSCRRRLEAIMHPLVRAEEARFKAAARRASRRAILLDIPLLFENGGRMRVDVSLVVSAPRAVQLLRVRRRGLATAQIEAIIASQMPDAQKRRLADYVIHTGLSKFNTIRQVRRVARVLLP